MTDTQIRAAPTAHGFRPAVRHPQSCIAPTLPAPSHAAYSSLHPFHTSRRASPRIDRYSKQNGAIRPGGHLQSYILRAISPRPNPGRRSATAFHPPRIARTPSTHHAEHRPELTDIQNRAAPSAPADICNRTFSAPFRHAPILAAAAPQRFTCRASPAPLPHITQSIARN